MNHLPTNSFEKYAIKVWGRFQIYKNLLYLCTATLIFVLGYFTAKSYSAINFEETFKQLFLDEPMKSITDLEGVIADKLLLSMIVWIGIYTALFYIVTDGRIEQRHFGLLSPIKSLLNIVYKYLLLILVFLLGFSTWIYFEGLNISVGIMLVSFFTFGLPYLAFLFFTKLVNYELMVKLKPYRYTCLISLLLLILVFSIWYFYLSVAGLFEKLDSWIKAAEVYQQSVN